MSGPTPGPWVHSEEDETVHGYSNEGEARIVVYELGTNPADARLIASAPDLLEALQLIVSSSDRNQAAILTSLVNKARAAIKKATGEEA